MTDITVLEDTSSAIDPATLPQHEREELFRHLISDGGKKPVDLVQLHAFMHLYDCSPRPVPERLPNELMARDVIMRMLRYDRVSVIPIITGRKKTGGAIKMFRPVLMKKVAVPAAVAEKAEASAAEISFDRPTTCLVNGRHVIAAVGDTVSIIGLRLFPLCGNRLRLSPHDGDRRTTCGYPAHTLDCSLFTQYTIGDKLVSAPFRDIYINEDSELFYHVAQYLYNVREQAVGMAPLIGQTISYIAEFATAPGQCAGLAKSALVQRILASMYYVNDAPKTDTVVQTSNGVEMDAFLEFTTQNFGAVSLVNESALHGALQLYGLLPAYMLYQMRGIDDENVRELIDRQLRHHTAGVQAIERAKDNFRVRTEFSVVLRILKKFLSSKRYNELPKTNIGALKAAMNPSELNKLELEVAVEKKYNDSAVNNRCPHVAIYARLRRATANDVKRKLLGDLSAFYRKDYPKNILVQCNRCRYDIICPHLIELIEHSREPIGKLRETLRKYVANELSFDGSQFCKICGETLFSRLDMQEDLHASVEFDDALRQLVWAQTAAIVRQLSFDRAVDVNRLIADIRDSIYPVAEIIDAELNRNQSHSSHEIVQRKTVFIAILAMARVVKIISNNSYVHMPGEKSSSVKSLIETGSRFLYNSLNVAISAIPNLTRENIRERITTVFGRIHGDITPEKSKTESVDEFYGQIIIDPTFAWIATRKGLSLANISRVFGAIFGMKPQELMKKIRADGKHNEFIFAHAKMPQIGQSFYDRVFQAWMRTARGKEPKMYYSSAEDPTLRVTPEYEKYMAMYDDLRAEERKQPATVERINSGFRGWSTTHIGGNPQVRRVPVKLGEIYDEEGREHVFNRYIINGKTYDRRELHDIMLSGRTKDVFGGIIRDLITDRVCSVCGVKASLMGKLDEDKILRSLNSKTQISGFFRFYEKRCPVNGVHEWDNTGLVCSKCGLNLGKDAERLNYYREFKDKYKEQRRSGAVVVRTEEPSAPPVAKNPGWKENFEYVVRVAEIAGVNARLIQYFGAYEGVDMVNIEDGKYTPTMVEDRNHSRVWAVYGIAVNLHSSWERLRTYSTAHIRSHGTEEILNGFNRANLSKLPSIGGEFLSTFDYFYQNEDPDRIITMCVQEWCSGLLQIYDYDDAPSETLRRKFVAAHVAETLAGQEMLTKREAFNWAIVFGSKKVASSSITNEEQVGEEPVGEKKEDPFSLDAFDVEGDVNIRVGSDFGLD